MSSTLKFPSASQRPRSPIVRASESGIDVRAVAVVQPDGQIGDPAHAEIGDLGAGLKVEQFLINRDDFTLVDRDTYQHSDHALGVRLNRMRIPGLVRVEVSLQHQVAVADHQYTVQVQVLGPDSGEHGM